MSTTILFAFTAWGVASAGSGYPPGERHAMLVFACAPDRREAEALASASVEAAGWTALTSLRGKVVPVAVDDIADDTVRSAARSACKDGCGFVAYDDPLPPDA